MTNLYEFDYEDLMNMIIDDILDSQMEDGYILNHIRDVKFNGPATIIFWEDGTKTVSVCSKEDTYDYEKGLAMCMLKYLLGDANYNDVFRIYVPDEEEDAKKEEALTIVNELLSTKKLTDKQKDAIKYLI